MKARGGVIAVVMTLAFCFSISSTLPAEEKKPPYEFEKWHYISDTLKLNTGKTVYIMLSSGVEIHGTIVKVGSNLVHVKELSRQEYYDAVIRTESIVGVKYGVRGPYRVE